MTLKRGQNVKVAPWAFTEHGAIMAATVLNSPRAVAKHLAALERRVTTHDADLKEVFTALRRLIEPQPKPPECCDTPTPSSRS